MIDRLGGSERLTAGSNTTVAACDDFLDAIEPRWERRRMSEAFHEAERMT
jgi:hypothetical protein